MVKNAEHALGRPVRQRMVQRRGQIKQQQARAAHRAGHKLQDTAVPGGDDDHHDQPDEAQHRAHAMGYRVGDLFSPA